MWCSDQRSEPTDRKGPVRRFRTTPGDRHDHLEHYEAPASAVGPTPPTPPVAYLPPPAPPQPKRGTAAIIVGAVILGSGFLTAVSGGVLLGHVR